MSLVTALLDFSIAVDRPCLIASSTSSKNSNITCLGTSHDDDGFYSDGGGSARLEHVVDRLEIFMRCIVVVGGDFCVPTYWFRHWRVMFDDALEFGYWFDDESTKAL